jgi:5'-phosphate synthase pdxT subunit
VGKKPKIAVIAMQGDYEKHLHVLNRLGAEAYAARLPQEVEAADGIILPGGESTTIGKMLSRYGVDEAIKQAAGMGKAIYGTCAGMILLARDLAEGTQERGGQPTLNILDAVVARNAFGRQIDSFEAELEVPEVGAEPLHAVFIRAP